MDKLTSIGKSFVKKDSVGLASGIEKFTDDFPLENPLYGALLYSSIAHGEIIEIDTSEAEKIEGVISVFTYKNVPHVLYTTAGQGYPEPSPYDSVLFDNKVRFTGDRVAMVAAETRETADLAISKIKVKYKEKEPLFDPEKAMEKDATVIHADEEYAKIPVPYKPEINLAAEINIDFGDINKGFDDSDFILEETYKMQYASHCALEPHSSAAFFDEKGRLVIISSTQVPFHARRIVSKLLDIPVYMLRVIKPRIGGGFGGKQEVLLEPLVALIAWKTKRNAKITLSRKEVFITTRTRHALQCTLKTGFNKDGEITTLQMDDLMNAGAYGSHALTVLSNAGSKVLPLFNKIKNMHFTGRSVYTNLPVGGAYRGYGATQGYFAFNQHIDSITRTTGQDILQYIKKWHIKEGETSEVFKAIGEGTEGVNQVIRSCKLTECIDKGAEAIEWYSKRGKQIKPSKNTVKGMGVAVSMQGSGIPKIDMASASMKMNEDGSFNLYVGATDLGTGSDTILAQIAAEVLHVPLNKIIVLSSDTDLTPFDVGAYASSTTYISGTAVKKCALKVLDQIIETASVLLKTEIANLKPDNEKIISVKTEEEISLEDICYYTLYTRDQFQIQGSASCTLPASPPPFIAQFAEVDVDKETGRVNVVNFVSAVDCGQPINPVLAEGQVEGAVVNGISYALCEDYIFNSKGRMLNPDFGNYKIYTIKDIPDIQTIIVESHEPTGPFGAKSISEIAINGPAPAIANAIFDAIGVRIHETPITPEKIWKEIKSGI